MTTISGLPADSPPLTGNELLPADQSLGGTTERVATADIARLGELYAALHLGAAPERIDQYGTYFSTQPTGEPVATWFAPSVANVTGFGYVIAVGGGGPVYQRGVMPAGPNQVWEVEADVEQVSIGSGENPIFQVGVASLKNDYTATSGANESYGPAVAIAAGQQATIRWRFATANVDPTGQLYPWNDIASASFLRPIVRANFKSDLSGACVNSVARIRRFKVRDVTSLISELARLKGRRRLNGGLI